MGNNKEKLNFLGSYWKQVNDIVEQFTNDLPYLIEVKQEKVEGFKHLKVIKFSDMNDWNISSENYNLGRLSNKLNQMAAKGNLENVPPLIKRLCTSKNPTFKWDWVSYTLSETEVNALKKYFAF